MAIIGFAWQGFSGTVNSYVQCLLLTVLYSARTSCLVMTAVSSTTTMYWEEMVCLEWSHRGIIRRRAAGADRWRVTELDLAMQGRIVIRGMSSLLSPNRHRSRREEEQDVGPCLQSKHLRLRNRRRTVKRMIAEYQEGAWLLIKQSWKGRGTG